MSQPDHTEILARRKAIGATQAEMAAWMGMSVRAYIDVEDGKTTRECHVLAARYLGLKNGCLTGDLAMIDPTTRSLALDTVAMIRGEDRLKTTVESLAAHVTTQIAAHPFMDPVGVYMGENVWRAAMLDRAADAPGFAQGGEDGEPGTFMGYPVTFSPHPDAMLTVIFKRGD